MNVVIFVSFNKVTGLGILKIASEGHYDSELHPVATGRFKYNLTIQIQSGAAGRGVGPISL